MSATDTSPRARSSPSHSAPTAPDPSPPGFFGRLFFLAWVAYFRTLFDPEFAAGVARLRTGRPALPPPPQLPESATPEPEASTDRAKKKEKEAPPAVFKEAPPDAALQLLALFQREGRLIDFLEEDVVGFTDAQVGAAARVVHEGCRRVLREHVPCVPICTEEEGSPITIAKGFDAQAIRLTGRVTGEPPYRGKVAHRGWRAKEVKLPKIAEGHDPYLIAPAEVEL